MNQKELNIRGLKANLGREDFIKLYLKKSMKSRIDESYPLDEAAKLFQELVMARTVGKYS